MISELPARYSSRALWTLVELGVGGDKDAAAWAGDINGDPYPKAQIALCGLAQDIAQALGGHAYGFHNSRR